MILSYAGYLFVQNMETIMRPQRTCWWRMLIIFMLVAVFIYASFVPLYMIGLHWNRSYTLYLKTECTYYNATQVSGVTVVDVHSLCSSHTAEQAESFTFYIKEEESSWPLWRPTDYDGMQCYVHKNNFRVRKPLGLDDRCCTCQSRCGRCCICCKCCACCPCQYHERGCCECANCCGMCWCIVAMLGVILPVLAVICPLCRKDAYWITNERSDSYVLTEQGVQLTVRAQHEAVQSHSTNAGESISMDSILERERLL